MYLKVMDLSVGFYFYYLFIIIIFSCACVCVLNYCLLTEKVISFQCPLLFEKLINLLSILFHYNFVIYHKVVMHTNQ